jgi:hypothetical protein
MKLRTKNVLGGKPPIGTIAACAGSVKVKLRQAMIDA